MNVGTIAYSIPRRSISVEIQFLLDSQKDLNKYIEVVEIYDEGSDWILRDYYRYSDVLKDALGRSKEATRAYNKVINLLTDTNDFYLKKVLEKLRDKSANLHWDDILEKIIIIDMM